jgi:hypothetical protein
MIEMYREDPRHAEKVENYNNDILRNHDGYAKKKR